MDGSVCGLIGSMRIIQSSDLCDHHFRVRNKWKPHFRKVDALAVCINYRNTLFCKELYPTVISDYGANFMYTVHNSVKYHILSHFFK
jgi:hypothetical protein